MIMQAQLPSELPDMTIEELSQTLEMSGETVLWLIPREDGGEDEARDISGAVRLLGRALSSTKERQKFKSEWDAAFGDIIRNQFQQKCAITGSTHSTQGAHLIGLAMGSAIFRALVTAITRLTDNFASIYLEGELKGGPVFADARKQIPIAEEEANINHPSNGVAFQSDVHDCHDRGKAWVYNPASERLLWLENTMAEGPLSRAHFGYLAAHLKSPRRPHRRRSAKTSGFE
ncbi:hypothetical protein FB451DRAFT_691635 [Mycena latifolia]|nr:hypothetical protein FB451DRAFT_691635 [Mycena latifolia]